MQPAVDDEAATDAGADGDESGSVGAAGRPAPPLTRDPGVAVVVERDRRADGLGDGPGEQHLALPTDDIRRPEHRAARLVDDRGDGDASGGRTARARRADHLLEERDDLRDDAVTPLARGFDVARGDDAAGRIAEPGGDLRAADIDAGEEGGWVHGRSVAARRSRPSCSARASRSAR